MEEQVYRFLLTSPGQDPAALGLGDAQLEPAVSRLIGLGLVTATADKGLVAERPEATLELLVQRRIARIVTDLRDVVTARDRVGALTTEADHAAGLMARIERLYGSDAVTDRILQDWQLEPASEVRAVKSRPRKPIYPRTDRLHTNTLFNLRRGIRYRTLLSSSTLDDPQYLDHVRALHKLGDSHRVTTDAIQEILVYDRTRAYVPLEAGNPLAGALRIQDPGVAATLTDLFDSVWERSTDLELYLLDRATANERKVLDALRDHETDEAAARHLNISVRTFRRHVADLMVRLNAKSRFQLAATAKEKGWF
ncbi:helix-turn-helix transcriptional regulator [Micromonospora echinaurantiaca]|uniref:helix-turn-helix transcriptional regulator n=1 Tax=Micromonospora echinaurantiaca TaxID=47857 RepID=UPI003437F8BA